MTILMFLPLLALGQVRSTQGAQIVVAINLDNNSVKALYPLEAIKKDQSALKSCDNCTHFLGKLTGKYEQKGPALEPLEEATVVVYKNQEVYSQNAAFPAGGFNNSDKVAVGRSQAIIIANKEDELILKTKTHEK